MWRDSHGVVPTCLGLSRDTRYFLIVCSTARWTNQDPWFSSNFRPIQSGLLRREFLSFYPWSCLEVSTPTTGSIEGHIFFIGLSIDEAEKHKPLSWWVWARIQTQDHNFMFPFLLGANHREEPYCEKNNFIIIIIIIMVWRSSLGDKRFPFLVMSWSSSWRDVMSFTNCRADLIFYSLNNL